MCEKETDRWIGSGEEGAEKGGDREVEGGRENLSSIPKSKAEVYVRHFPD